MSDLRPGDCLLYKSRGLFGKIIALKTWHDVAHCEVYAGNGFSWASRDGLGVNKYPWRNTELAHVLRPTAHLDLAAADYWATRQIGTPYGWLELLNFLNITTRGYGLFCSEFATYYYRQAGWMLFPHDDPAQIAPFQFLDLLGASFAEIV